MPAVVESGRLARCGDPNDTGLLVRPEWSGHTIGHRVRQDVAAHDLATRRLTPDQALVGSLPGVVEVSFSRSQGDC